MRSEERGVRREVTVIHQLHKASVAHYGTMMIDKSRVPVKPLVTSYYPKELSILLCLLPIQTPFSRCTNFPPAVKKAKVLRLITFHHNISLIFYVS